MNKITSLVFFIVLFSHALNGMNENSNMSVSKRSFWERCLGFLKSSTNDDVQSIPTKDSDSSDANNLDYNSASNLFDYCRAFNEAHKRAYHNAIAQGKTGDYDQVMISYFERSLRGSCNDLLAQEQAFIDHTKEEQEHQQKKEEANFQPLDTASPDQYFQPEVEAILNDFLKQRKLKEECVQFPFIFTNQKTYDARLISGFLERINNQDCKENSVYNGLDDDQKIKIHKMQPTRFGRSYSHDGRLILSILSIVNIRKKMIQEKCIINPDEPVKYTGSQDPNEAIAESYEFLWRFRRWPNHRF